MQAADCPTQDELKKDCHDDLLFYTQVCDPKYQVSRVHEFIASKLQAVADGKIRRLILNMPPQHGKSRLCSMEFPTWLFGRNPSMKFVTASYAQKLSDRNSREARARMLSEEYQYVFDTRLDPTNQAVENWGLVGGGYYKAVGIGGALTGHAADGIVIDDPFKDHAEAHSPAQRETVWDWFLSVVYTRLSPAGFIIIIMTRWHVDDLVGRLLDPQRNAELKEAGIDSEEFEHINLPGLAEENDPIGRKPGEALYPEKYSAQRVKAIMKVLGSYKASALYNGRPVQKGGNYINMEDFQILPARRVPEGLRWMRFWDLGATKKDEMKKKAEPDYSAGVKGALGPPPPGVRVKLREDEDPQRCCLYIADITKGQWEWPTTREKIKTIATAERILIGVEAVGGFKTSYQNLREVLPPDIMSLEIGVDKDKLTRALPWIALVEDGKVFLVQGDWNMDFMNECESFPSGAHDDQVDGVSGVYAMLRSGRKIMVA